MERGKPVGTNNHTSERTVIPPQLVWTCPNGHNFFVVIENYALERLGRYPAEVQVAELMKAVETQAPCGSGPGRRHVQWEESEITLGLCDRDCGLNINI